MVSSVYTYLPNMIGYARILLTFVGYSYALVDHHVMIGCYMFSQLLDAADGYAARVLDQSSTFGAVLDMVTDRTSTTCLCVVLARLYPQLIVPLIALVFLDLFSHWYHMYASLLLGNTSHKMCENALLKLYYYRPVLFIICSGTECWYISLYTLAFTRGPPLPLLGYPLVVSFFALCTPVFVFKQVANVVQLFIACQSIVAHDEASRAARQGSKQVRASPRKRSKSPLKKNQ